MSRDKKRIAFFISILLLWSNASFAQQVRDIKPDQYRANHWIRSEGLPSGINHVMLKDDKGFLWIGSTLGLSRFDGSLFKEYTSDDSSRGAINSTAINSLVEDSLHNIWIGTRLGLSRYDSRADTFTNIPIPDDPDLPADLRGNVPFWATKNEIFCIEPGFVITSYNVNTLSPKVIKRFSERKILAPGVARISAIYDVGSKSIWLLAAGETGLVQLSLADLRITPHKYPILKKKADFAGHADSEAMCYDQKRNCLWINGHEGLVKFSLSDLQFHYIHALDEFTNRKDYSRYVGIDLDPHGRIWMATGDGILIYDPETQRVILPLSDPVLQHKAAKNNWQLYCDRDGIAWTSNYLAGELYEIIPVIQPAKKLTANPKRKGALSSSLISTIVPGPQGKLWVGTIDGLNIFDPITEKFEVLREKDLPGIRGTAIIPLYIDTIRQKAWINATRDPIRKYSRMDMYEMDLKTRQCRQIIFRDGSKIIENYAVYHTMIKPYKDGLLFFDDYNGVFEIKPGSLTANRIIPNQHAYGAFALIDDRQLFLQAGGGLPNSAYENKNGVWTKTPHFLDTLNWYCFYENPADQTYWISFKNEVVHFDRHFGKIGSYKAKNSFNDIISAIITDRDGKVWMLGAQSKEIGRLDPVTGIYSKLRPTDGHIKQEYGWYTPVASDNQGNLYFGMGFYLGTTSADWGLDRIFPEQYASIDKPPVYLESLTINQKPFGLFGDLNRLEELKLRHNQNTLRIEVGIIDFYSKEKGNIRYKLDHDGKVSEWQYPPDKVIRYEDLSPGPYQLVIQASNTAGEYIGPEKTLLITITPPFWQTWWFRILAAVLVIGMIYGFIQYRSRDLKKRNILLEQKISERTSQLVERTNELNNSLSELKTTQDQLIHSEKMASLGELTSGIAHEIKNPLNFINNFSELNLDLMAEIEGEQLSRLDENTRAELVHIIKTMRKNSEKINHHGKRVDDIVKSMLQHSRIGNLTKEPVDVNALCEESLKLAYHGFKAKEKTFNAAFEMHFDPDLPRIMAVPQDLGRVLLNLFNNAFYAVHEKKTQPVSTDASEIESSYTPLLTVSTRKSEKNIIIAISDNGTGISQKIISKIFQPFFTTKPTGEGTGLGLSMSYDIITKSHGGELLVKSKEGTGSDFEILLPV